MKNTKIKYLNNLFLIILSVLLFICSFSIFSQNSYPTPHRFGEKDIPKVVEGIEFYPIGWSKNADFAYIFLPPSGMRGGTPWKLIIQNAKSDNIIVSIDMEYEFGNDVGNSWYSFDDLWEDTYRKFKYILDKYKIRAQLEDFYNFSNISTKNGRDFKVSYRTIEDEFDTVGFRIKISNGYGSKTISRFNKDEKINDIRYIGSIKSPYENRVIILTAYNQYDWQGDYDGVNLHLSGSSLSSGFK